MNYKMITPALIIAAIISSSCTSLSSNKKEELREWRSQGLEIEEKSQSTAAVLNVLPGIGDFYNGNIGYGVANLLLWPLSILWAPVGGATGAEEVNYYTTQRKVSKLEKIKKQTKEDLQNSLVTNQISQQEYIFANRKLERMDLKEFNKPVDVQDLIPTPMERTPSSSKK